MLTLGPAHVLLVFIVVLESVEKFPKRFEEGGYGLYGLSIKVKGTVRRHMYYEVLYDSK